MPKIYKIFFALFLLFLLTPLAQGLADFRDNSLKVYFLDVGQGDAILIRTPAGQNILIDGGPDNSILEQLNDFLPFWERTIDLMVLTHPHADHVTGLVAVLKHYQVKKAIYTGVVHTAPAYLAWLKELARQKIPLVLIDRRQTISLAQGGRLKILYPEHSLAGQTAANLNNTSIVIKLEYKQVSFLFTGDIEAEAENELLASGQDLRAQVLKAPHHGSHTSSQLSFLKAVAPQFAVIEVGANNEFGQPSARVLRRCQKLGIKVFRTDQDGSVAFFTDGYKIKTKKYLPKK